MLVCHEHLNIWLSSQAMIAFSCLLLYRMCVTSLGYCIWCHKTRAFPYSIISPDQDFSVNWMHLELNLDSKVWTTTTNNESHTKSSYKWNVFLCYLQNEIPPLAKPFQIVCFNRKKRRVAKANAMIHTSNYHIVWENRFALATLLRHFFFFLPKR